MYASALEATAAIKEGKTKKVGLRLHTVTQHEQNGRIRRNSLLAVGVFSVAGRSFSWVAASFDFLPSSSLFIHSFILNSHNMAAHKTPITDLAHEWLRLDKVCILAPPDSSFVSIRMQCSAATYAFAFMHAHNE